MAANYLAEAAALLKKAADENEQENKRYPGMLRDGRLEIAREYARLAAIEKGIAPADLEFADPATA